MYKPLNDPNVTQPENVNKKLAAMQRRFQATQQKKKNNDEATSQRNNLIFARKMGLGGY